MRPSLTLLLLLLIAMPAYGKDVYQEPEAFLVKAFSDNVPDPSVVWLSGETRDRVESIFGHNYRGARIRYWQRDNRTAWILEEIGKKKPITTGLIVEGDKLARIRVLIYRESRGWEVRQDFFTQQFKGATLTDDYQLDRYIDGISGATLSVRALTRLARVALFLHETVSEEE